MRARDPYSAFHEAVLDLAVEPPDRTGEHDEVHAA
jgi:hypothetical protein